jgi:hypothetical protein
MCFFVFGRKRVLKNLTWRLPWLSVRSAIPFSFSIFLVKTLAYLSHLCVSLNLLLSLIRGPFVSLNLLLSLIRGPFLSCSAGQLHNKLRIEAKERGEEYKVTKLRRNIEMDEYDLIHWRRSFEEREALLRDISWYSHRHYISILNIRYLTIIDLCAIGFSPSCYGVYKFSIQFQYDHLELKDFQSYTYWVLGNLVCKLIH